MELSKRTLRQIKNMSHICDFNLEHHIAKIPLYYETPDELIDIHLSRPGVPVVSDDAVEYLQSIISNIPEPFKVEFELTIADYGDYDHKQLLNAIKKTVENTFYYYDEHRKKDKVLSVFFLMLGIIILAVDVIGSNFGWFDITGSTKGDIIINLMDILAWVFLWEGGAILFLTYETDATVFHRDIQRFNGVSFKDPSGAVLCALDRESFYQGWIQVGKKEHLARNFIIFSNAFLLALLSVEIVECIAVIDTITHWEMVFYSITWIIVLLVCLCNICYYTEKYSIGRFALPLSIILTLICAADMIVWFSYSIIDVKLFVIDILAIVSSVINIICLNILRKQYIEIETQEKSSDHQ